MSTDRAINNRRLLEAIEYLDSKYIDEMFDDLKVTPRGDTPDARRSPFKYWKQFVALAACVVLLAFSAPIVGYISEVISNFRAGAGSETVESSEMLNSNLTDPIETEQSFTTESIETEQPAVTDPVFQYVVSREEFDEMTAAWKIFRNSERAYIVKDYKWFTYWYPCSGVACVYKKEADVIVFCRHSMEGWYGEITIAGYLFKLPSMEELWVYKNKEFYSLSQAYESGILSEEDIKELSEIHHEHLYGENRFG